jgi:drug/metabolite transporter (DMT)-like permease
VISIQAAAERRPVVLICVGVVLFSIGPVLFASADSSGQVIAFWRLLFGVVILGTATLVHVRVTGHRPTRAGWSWSVRCGVMFVSNQLCFLAAVHRTSVADVTLMQVLQPLLVAGLAVRMFGERPGRQFRAWSLVAVAGAAVVAIWGSTGHDGDPAGMTFAIASIVLFAVYFVWAKQARDAIDTVPFLFGVALTGWVVVAASFVVTGGSPREVTSHTLVLAVVIAAGPGAVGHFVSTWPLRWVPANVPPLLQLAIPFLASALAWIALGQPIRLGHVVGGAITMIGVAGAIRSPAGRRMVAREEILLATEGAE